LKDFGKKYLRKVLMSTVKNLRMMLTPEVMLELVGESAFRENWLCNVRVDPRLIMMIM